MAFNHKVHHYDSRGKVNKITPYTKVCRKGLPEIYFDHVKKRFFDPGSMNDALPSIIPDDVWERYMGAPKKVTAKEVQDAPVKDTQAAPKKRGRPKKTVEASPLDEDQEPIVVTADTV